MLRLASWIVVVGLFAGAECQAQSGLAAPAYGNAPRLWSSPQARIGPATSIDLKEATLGQVVDALTSSSSSAEGVKPINVLISGQLREIPVGTIKLNNVYPVPRWKGSAS